IVASRSDDLPILRSICSAPSVATSTRTEVRRFLRSSMVAASRSLTPTTECSPALQRSEEHTSELQSLMRHSYAVFCLQKKNNKTQHHIQHYSTNIVLKTI